MPTLVVRHRPALAAGTTSALSVETLPVWQTPRATDEAPLGVHWGTLLYLYLNAGNRSSTWHRLSVRLDASSKLPACPTPSRSVWFRLGQSSIMVHGRSTALAPLTEKTCDANSSSALAWRARTVCAREQGAPGLVWDTGTWQCSWSMSLTSGQKQKPFTVR